MCQNKPRIIRTIRKNRRIHRRRRIRVSTIIRIRIRRNQNQSLRIRVSEAKRLIKYMYKY